MDTVTPRLSPVEYTDIGSQVNSNTIGAGNQTITEGASTVTTVLPIPPVNIEIVPNPDIIQFASPEVVQSMADKASSVASSYAQLMWIQQSVDVMMSRAELVNNLHPAMDALEKANLVTNLF